MQKSLMQRLYWIADSSAFMSHNRFLDAIEKAVTAAVGFIQYRNKAATPTESANTCRAIGEITRNTATRLVINDDPTLAQKLMTDDNISCGVHLGQRDISIVDTDQLKPRPSFIGASCYNNLDRARQVRQLGADYVSFGAIFPSQTKPEAEPASLTVLTAAKETLDCPIIAIGGITPTNALDVLNAGADHIAVAGALNRAENFNNALQAFDLCFSSFSDQSKHLTHLT